MVVRVNRRRRSRRQNNGGEAVSKYFGDAWSLAKRTAYGLNEIRKLINIETKIAETISGSTAFSASGVIVPISQISQGTDYINNRIGNSIKLQKIEVRGRVYKNATATQSVMRVVMFRDLDGYGTTPLIGDVLQNVSGVSAPLTPFDFNNRQRFSILMDELLTLNSTGESSSVFQLDLTHEGHILYLGATAAAASDGKGSLYMLFISDEAVNTPTFNFYSRLYYTDD
jgi:hypothetical protein